MLLLDNLVVVYKAVKMYIRMYNILKMSGSSCYISLLM